MTPSEQLFDEHPDWLSHTLALANKAPDPSTVTLADGTRIDHLGLGVLRLTPAHPSALDPLIVSAGVHGNETAPIEVLNNLVTELLEAQWPLQRETLLILGNPPAMVAGTRFIDHNLNRLFSGAHRQASYSGSPEAQRAHWLEATCQAFAASAAGLLHYDLHTAIRPSMREKFALYPFVQNRKVPLEQVAFLAASDVSTLLLQHKSGTTFSSFTSSHLGAESFTIELGQVRPFGQNDLSRFEGIHRSLRGLMSGQSPTEDATKTAADVVVFEVVEEVINTGDGFRFHVPDDVANFTEYPPGEVIWEDTSTCYRVGDQPEAIVFPNREVPVGQRVGLLVRKLPAH